MIQESKSLKNLEANKLLRIINH